MSGLLTDAYAMTLIWIFSVILMVVAAFIIVVGGRPARDRTRPKRRHIKPERPKAA